MSKYDYTLIRRASRPWICADCGEIISKGERYVDRGWRNYYKEWFHVRRHIRCHPEPEEYPIPVSLSNGTKEWLLGAVHDMGGCQVLLTHDWDMKGKYHFRKYVYNADGNLLSAKNLQKVEKYFAL